MLRFEKAAATASQTDWPRVVEADALATGLPRADAAGPSVEEHGQPELLAALEERPVLLVVGGEGLERGMELHALQPELGNPVQLGHCTFALVRIDAAEADETIWVMAARFGHQLVGHARAAGRGLGVPGEQDRDDIDRLVVASQLLEGAPDHLGVEISFGGLDVSTHGNVEPLRRRQVD